MNNVYHATFQGGPRITVCISYWALVPGSLTSTTRSIESETIIVVTCTLFSSLKGFYTLNHLRCSVTKILYLSASLGTSKSSKYDITSNSSIQIPDPTSPHKYKTSNAPVYKSSETLGLNAAGTPPQRPHSSEHTVCSNAPESRSSHPNRPSPGCPTFLSQLQPQPGKSAFS